MKPIILKNYSSLNNNHFVLVYQILESGII